MCMLSHNFFKVIKYAVSRAESIYLIYFLEYMNRQMKTLEYFKYSAHLQPLIPPSLFTSNTNF